MPKSEAVHEVVVWIFCPHDLPLALKQGTERGEMCLTISDACWDGDEQTVVHINQLLPALSLPGQDDDGSMEARWQLRTSKPPHLYGFPAPPEALKAFHLADAKKGPSTARA